MRSAKTHRFSRKRVKEVSYHKNKKKKRAKSSSVSNKFNTDKDKIQEKDSTEKSSYKISRSTSIKNNSRKGSPKRNKQPLIKNSPKIKEQRLHSFLRKRQEKSKNKEKRVGRKLNLYSFNDESFHRNIKHPSVPVF